jgi:hypothetical protein
MADNKIINHKTCHRESCAKIGGQEKQLEGELHSRRKIRD